MVPSLPLRQTLVPAVLALLHAAAACGPGAAPDTRPRTADTPPPPPPERRADPAPARPKVSDADLRAAIKRKPDQPELHFTLALRLQRAGKLEEAIEAYQAAIALRAEYYEAHHNLAVIFLGRRDFMRAGRHYERAWMGKPSDFELLSRAAHCYLEANDLDLADKVIQRGLTRPEHRGKLLWLQSVLLLRRKQPDAALRALEQAVAAGHGTADVHARIGALKLKKKQESGALDAFRAALAKDPDHPLALASLGGLLLRIGNVREALPLLRKAVTRMPKDPGTHVNLALASLRGGDPPGALAPARRAVELAPDQPLAKIALGVALLFDGKADEGGKLLADTVRKSKDLANLLGGYVQPLVDAKQVPGAVALLEALLVGQPGNAVARKNLKILKQRLAGGR
jgi:tetratricopeptide (TPR) repeat protein